MAVSYMPWIAAGFGAASSSFAATSTAPPPFRRGTPSGRLGTEWVLPLSSPLFLVYGRRAENTLAAGMAGVLFCPQRLQNRPRWCALSQWRQDITGPSCRERHGQGRCRGRDPIPVGAPGTSAGAVPHLGHRRRPAQGCSAVTPVSSVPSRPGSPCAGLWHRHTAGGAVFVAGHAGTEPAIVRRSGLCPQRCVLLVAYTRVRPATSSSAVSTTSRRDATSGPV